MYRKQKYVEHMEEIRHLEDSKEIYVLRSQTIERIFSDTKKLHRIRYTQYKRLAKFKIELFLKFACINLKKQQNEMQRVTFICCFRNNFMHIYQK